MRIVAIGFSNYRSVGSLPIIVNLDKRVNLLIGANNSGKSNVLDLLRRLKKDGLQKINLSETDFHRRDGNRPLTLIFDVQPDAADVAKLPEGTTRFHFQVSGATVSGWLATPFDSLDYQQLQPFMLKVLNERWGSRPNEETVQDYRKRISSHFIGPLGHFIPEVHVIPQFRRIVSGEYSIDGAGVIELLGRWQAPDIGQDADRDRFNRVQDFLRELLLMDDVTLDVSRPGSQLLVQRGDLRLPLANYGTGIHQLIILAIAVLAYKDAVIGIEEPEIHLHPLLQKALLRFLIDKTTNRYLITTHSNAFLSRPKDSHIIHLWLEDQETKSRAVETPAHVLQVLNDLGIRAADLLQANFVLWTEGPSDRIYINRWLKIAAPELVEGIDYAVMFYGGRLLSHVSLERDEPPLSAEEVIKLLRINQHSAILIDCDKASESDEINETKQRIVKECQESGVLCWVSAGREIENYLTPESISDAYDSITGTTQKVSLGRFEKIEDAIQTAYSQGWRASFGYDRDKPGYARKIVAHINDSVPDRFDLRTKVDELVKQIRAAN
jgi:hypothetical protein